MPPFSRLVQEVFHQWWMFQDCLAIFCPMPEITQEAQVFCFLNW
jgi:hypothetical protein